MQQKEEVGCSSEVAYLEGVQCSSQYLVDKKLKMGKKHGQTRQPRDRVIVRKEKQINIYRKNRIPTLYGKFLASQFGWTFTPKLLTKTEV